MGEAASGLLERARELEQLRERVREARAGAGSLVLIEGPAGIGKTSLLAAARALASEAGVEVLSSRAGLLERELPWNLVRQLFGGVVGTSDQRREELLAGAGALAGPALGLAAGATAGGADDTGALHGLYWLTTTLCERAPLLLAVDDGQWADADSLRYLAYMAERVSDLRLLLAVTVRTGEPQPVPLRALGQRAGSERIELKALSATASEALVRCTLGDDAADEFCAACHLAAGGNPFILNELLGQLRRDRVEPTGQNAVAVARVTPESVKRSVLLRLSMLPATAHELASTLAVLGSQAPLFVAARAANLDGASATSAADALTDAGILARTTQLSFVHPLVREVIYSELPEHARGRRHRAAAETLAALGADAQRVAAQLTQAAPDADRWVVERLREAARAALVEGAPQSAVGFLRRALQEPPSDSIRVTVLRELARAEARNESGRAIGHLEQAFADAHDPRERAELGLELILMLSRAGQMQRAIELAYEVLAAMPAEARALDLGVIAAATLSAILVPELHAHVDHFIERIPNELQGETSAERLALLARLAVALTRSAPMSEVADLAARALGGGVLLQDLPSHELLYWNAASALVVADRFDTARSAIDAAFGDARSHGSIVGFALSSCIRCLLDYRVGDVREGVLDGRQALDASSPEELHIRAYSVAFLIDCLIERGELDTALSLGWAPEFCGELPKLFVFQLLRIARARARIEAGDPDAGVRELLEVAETMRLGRFSPAVSPWRTRTSRGLGMLDRGREARELAEEELSLARETQSAWVEAVALNALAAAAPARAGEHLEQAIEIAESHGFGLERARSLLALGALHRRQGKRGVAAELLKESLDQSARCGALALEQRAHSELTVAGLRPRRRRLSGVDALTPAERRVAQLAAESMSNRAIAQSLFLSLRTVETHLTRCYQKLGIESRAGLAAALQDSAPAMSSAR